MYYIYPQDMSRKLFMSAKRHKEHRYLSGTKNVRKKCGGRGFIAWAGRGPPQATEGI